MKCKNYKYIVVLEKVDNEIIAKYIDDITEATKYINKVDREVYPHGRLKNLTTGKILKEF